jgi:hypothetical protein
MFVSYQQYVCSSVLEFRKNSKFKFCGMEACVLYCIVYVEKSNIVGFLQLPKSLIFSLCFLKQLTFERVGCESKVYFIIDTAN